MISTKESFQYLTSRLERIGQGECLNAAKLVGLALSSGLSFPLDSEAEHALYSEIWQCITQALDVPDFDPAYENEVYALEAEMAGHVLFYRLAKGWLARTKDAPTDFRSFAERLP